MNLSSAIKNQTLFPPPVVVVSLVLPWMIGIALSVNIVVDLGIPRTSVGICMDVYKIFLYVQHNKGEAVVDFEVIDSVHIQLLLRLQILLPLLPHY